MANRYGEAALMAVRMELHGKALSPAERWEDAVRKAYPTTPIGQKKSGPRQAFVGLCEAGLVKGVEAGEAAPATSVANRNKAYAVKAVELLKAGTHKTVTQLWEAVVKFAITMAMRRSCSWKRGTPSVRAEPAPAAGAGTRRLPPLPTLHVGVHHLPDDGAGPDNGDLHHQS